MVFPEVLSDEDYFSAFSHQDIDYLSPDGKAMIGWKVGDTSDRLLNKDVSTPSCLYT
ncbi:hypothetical protein KSD_79480 [Ktedonobacter sp. SOSP1-85]|nr:hypothetical protein KSD_79480 [Ktedonobacter sp. SOSP1-85]